MITKSVEPLSTSASTQSVTPELTILLNQIIATEYLIIKEFQS